MKKNFKNQIDSSRDGRGRFKKGAKTGRPRKKERLGPIVEYLKGKLPSDFPEVLIERLSEGLTSRDDKVFLDSFKSLIKVLPIEQAHEIPLPPHVQDLLIRGMGLQIELGDNGVLEDQDKDED